jgi:hypothetical protein
MRDEDRARDLRGRTKFFVVIWTRDVTRGPVGAAATERRARTTLGADIIYIMFLLNNCFAPDEAKLLCRFKPLTNRPARPPNRAAPLHFAARRNYPNKDNLLTQIAEFAPKPPVIKALPL